MVKFFQNRELAQALGINLAKWKRWSREFLPPDPLGGLQSGYARQYNLDDAFIVYLGGYLVSELKFSIPEAKQILNDLKDWMISNRFYYYYDHINGKEPLVASQGESYRIHIFYGKTQPGGPRGIDYRIKRILARYSEEIDGKGVVMERTVEERFQQSPNSSSVEEAGDRPDMEWGARLLQITDLYYHFLELLEMTWVVDGPSEQ